MTLIGYLPHRPSSLVPCLLVKVPTSTVATFYCVQHFQIETIVTIILAVTTVRYEKQIIASVAPAISTDFRNEATGEGLSIGRFDK